MINKSGLGCTSLWHSQRFVLFPGLQSLGVCPVLDKCLCLLPNEQFE